MSDKEVLKKLDEHTSLLKSIDESLGSQEIPLPPEIQKVEVTNSEKTVFPETQKVEVTNFPETKAPIVNLPAPIVNVSPPMVEVNVPEVKIPNIIVPEIKIPTINIPEPFSIIPKHDEIRIETSGRTEVARYFLNGKQTGTIRVTYSDDQRTQAVSIKRE